jgi:hypothetical protein
MLLISEEVDAFLLSFGKLVILSELLGMHREVHTRNSKCIVVSVISSLKPSFFSRIHQGL